MANKLPPKVFSKWRLWAQSVDRQGLSDQAAQIEKNLVRHARKFVIKRLDRIRVVKRQVLFWVVLMILLFAALALQILVSQSQYTRLTNGRGGSYREGAVGTIESLNPLLAKTATERAASQLIFSSLFAFDNLGYLKGDLAKTLSLSADEKTYTVIMRDDAVWHDGQSLTADDVVFTVNLLKDPAMKLGSASAWRGIEVQKISDFSVEFRLPSAYAPFNEALTFPILPKHLLADLSAIKLREADFNKRPIGSGAFKFRLLQSAETAQGREQVLHLSRFDNYYGSSPLVERFEIYALANKEQLLRLMKKHEINAAVGVSLPELNGLKSWRSQLAPINNATFLFFNNERHLLKQIAFRQALRQAINLEQVRQQFNAQFGNYWALDYPILARSLGQDLSAQNWFNIAQAEAKMTSLGYTKVDQQWLGADNQALKLNLVAIKESHYAELAELLAQQLRHFGLAIHVDLIDLNDPSTNFVRNILQPRDYDLLVYELELGFDPDQFVYWHSSQKSIDGLNLANYANPIVDDLLVSARSKNNQQLRLAKYQSFIKQWLDDAPALALHQSMLNYALLNGSQAFNNHSRFVTVESRFANLDQFAVNNRLIYTTP